MHGRGWIALGACALLGSAATAMDGAKTVCQPVATVLGNPICPEDIDPKAAAQPLKARAEKLLTLVEARVLEEYAKEKNLEPTAGEMKLLGEALDAESEFRRGLPRDEVERNQRLFYSAIILSFKVHRSLYQTYGGRVLLSGFGAEPIGAIESYLKERERRGAFKIQDPELEQAFWEAMKRPDRAGVEGEKAREAFEIPPWEAARKPGPP